jgi:hypothetical protein
MKAGAAGLGGLAALALLVPMEAGVPIPLPADLVMFGVGERVAAGAFPLWLAVVGFEVVAIVGTTALFAACRGPAHRVIARFGPRLGLTQARVGRMAAYVEARGGVLAGPARQAGGHRSLGGSRLPGLHGPEPDRRPGPGPGRADRARSGEPGAGREPRAGRRPLPADRGQPGTGRRTGRARELARLRGDPPGRARSGQPGQVLFGVQAAQPGGEGLDRDPVEYRPVRLLEHPA